MSATNLPPSLALAVDRALADLFHSMQARAAAARPQPTENAEEKR